MIDSHVLLLTDLVDSTRLTEELGDIAAAALWTAHDRLARDLLPKWHGREIDKTDGMLLLFSAVRDAVGYAMEYHAALASGTLPLRARAGLHVGPLVLRENSPEDVALGAKPLEVDGIAKPTAGRVMSLAQGGQLLLTQQAVAALGDVEAAAWSLRSHGHWELKGVAEPLELYELSDGATKVPAPADADKAFRVVRRGDGWVPVREIANNLPQPVTSFVGRERDVAEVQALLRETRLVTLLGMGGLGKTRLSLQVAEAIKHRHADGVWFIDLSPLRDPQLVAAVTAQVLGVRDEPERPLLQTLCAHLKTRRVLLVLDNCEHLVQAAADLAHALLRAAPHLRILASSREALRVPGETAYPVLPLPLPARGSNIDALMQSTAVRLFVDRARSYKPSLVLGERDAPALSELVARLEGIPLAIELAAARVRALSVSDINLRLRDRYKLLTGGGRALQERQQTLRALVDWSYDMLGGTEQTLLQRLGIFVGGFDLEAAEVVCGDEPLAIEDVLDLLTSLVEKSLVMAEEQEQGTRYRMLETIREYAREKLDASGSAAHTAQRHCDHCFVLAKHVRDGMRGADQAMWTARLEADLDNIRAATALSLAGGVDTLIALKISVALQNFWILRGYATEARGVLRMALELPAVQASDRAHAFALYAGAALAETQSDHAEARQMLQTCLALRRRLGNPVEIAATLSTLSISLLSCGDVDGAAACEREAVELFTAAGDTVGVCIGLLHLGQCAIALGDEKQARSDLDQSLALARSIMHNEAEAECELLLGSIEFDAGKTSAAKLHFTSSQATCLGAGDKRGSAHALRWLGKVDLVEGRLEQARQRVSDALQDFHSFEMREDVFACIEDLAQLAALQGQAGLAAQLAAAVGRSRVRLALDRLPRQEQRWQAWLDTQRTSLGDAEFDAAWAVGRGWEIDEAMRRATSAAEMASEVS